MPAQPTRSAIARVRGPAKQPAACEAKVAEIAVTELPAAKRIRISLAIPSPGTGPRFFWIDLSEDDSKFLRALLLAAETAGGAA